MQRSVYIILLPLFLCTLFGIISVSYSYSDIQDSVLSTSLGVSGSNINFSAIIGENNQKGAYLLTFATVYPTQLAIMPPKSRTTRKRMLLEDDHNSVNLYHADSQGVSLSTQGDMREMTDNQPSIAPISENSFADEATQSTRRRKKRALHHNGASENLCCVEHEDTDAVGQRDKQFQSNQQNPNTMVNQSLFAGGSSSNDAGNTIVGGSSFCGQASYQKIKQAIIGENNQKGAYLLTIATVHPTQLASLIKDAEQFLIFNNIDQLWKEYLQALKFIQQALGLHGYAQPRH